jgi:hypothetical protein
VRNRVALKAVRTRAAMTSKLVRMSVVMALVPVVLLGAAQSASAADGKVAAQSVSFGLGPVSIAAVAIGFGGLVIGLLRHRRREAASVAASVVAPPVEPRPGEHAA